MSRNSYFNIDESKIIKKDDINDSKSLNDNVTASINGDVSEYNEYLKIIKEYSNNVVVQTTKKDKPLVSEIKNIVNDDLDNILKDVYKKPSFPVYQYKKDINSGQIIIDTKKEDDKLNKPKISINRNEIEDLITLTNKEISLVKVEIEVHKILVYEEKSAIYKSSYNNKLQSLNDDLVYLLKKQKILQNMMK